MIVTEGIYQTKSKFLHLENFSFVSFDLEPLLKNRRNGDRLGHQTF